MKKKMFSAVMCVVMVIGIMGSAFSVSADSDGISITPVKTSDKMFASQIEELLLDSSPVERELLLEKISYAGITSDDLPNVSLSKNEVAILERKVSITKQARTNKRILTASSNSIQSMGEPLYTPMSNVGGVDMPDYALWPTIYKQYTNVACRAGTIYTVLMYIKGSSPSQQTIMANCVASLPYMCDYLNDYKPDDYASYLYSLYGGDQYEFNWRLAYDVNNYQPMVFAMKNSTTSTANWPYRTDGHYSICAGLLTWEDNQYFIGDPYYFSGYVAGAGNTGYHNKSWGQLNTVITNSHGAGNQHIVW